MPTKTKTRRTRPTVAASGQAGTENQPVVHLREWHPHGPGYGREHEPHRHGSGWGREHEHHRHRSECAEECEPRHDWPDRYCGPTLLDLAIAKRYEFGSLFLLGAGCLQRPCCENFYSLGLRLAEAARLTLALKQSFWQSVVPRAVVPWAARPWENPDRWQDERCEPVDCRPEREERWCHRCGCREDECECVHREERRCESCGCREDECHCGRRGSTDIRIEGRENDVRSKVIMVENNSPRALKVTLEADPWTDSHGATVPTTITFAPTELDLAPGEAKESTATVDVAASLASGVSYFTRIHLMGSCAKPISVELCVEPQNCIAVYAKTDPCRPRRGTFVEYCDEPDCDDPCARRHRHHDPCGPERWASDPWRWQQDPWRWLGPDPFRYWYGSQYIRRFWLTPPAGVRCC